jgi:DNA repair exonuclease SbcCD ATPase subunit
MDTKTADNVVGELEDKLKQRDRTILELRQEAEEAQALIAELREHAQDHVETLESWIEAFEIVAGDDGHYHWPNVYRQYNELVDSYDALRREWNRLVPKYNAAIEPRGLGRPLAASEAQQRKVLAMRKAGESLRAIVSGTGLTLRTVRTIIGKADGTDRTTKRTNEIRRLELNRNRMAAYRARKRTRDALPKRITDLLARGKSLVKRAR